MQKWSVKSKYRREVNWMRSVHKILHWPGCQSTPTGHNEPIKLELLRVWELLDSS